MLIYNRETLAARAIESIFAQTFRDFEFIIVDNGSTDASGAIVDEYAAKDSRIRVIHRERGNIGAGRNAGLDAARGEYVAFIDDDDYVEPDFLEFLCNLAIDNAADTAICGANKEIPSKEQKLLIVTKFVHDKLLVMDAEEAIIAMLSRQYFNTTFPTKLIRRSLFDNLRFPESGKYDDIALMHLVLAGAKRTVYHGLPKYVFSRHDDNNSGWTTDHSKLTAETLNEYLRVYRERTMFLCERFSGNAAMWRYFDWSFQISMVDKVYRYNIEGCGEYLAKMLGDLRVHREEFYDCLWIQEFERDWVRKYVPFE
jgi:glycosyltransferase involved in cell wall biosynthesis